MLSVLANVAPVFLLILSGALVMRLKLAPKALGSTLGALVFRFGLPVLLFRTMALASYGNASPLSLWLAYFTGVTVAWTAGHLAATRLFGEKRPTGVIAGIASAFANNVFIGLPLVQRMVGPEGLVALSILLAIHLPVMMIAGTVLMERASRATGRAGSGLGRLLRQTLVNLLRNPLVIGIVLGALWNRLGLGLPPLVRLPLDWIGWLAGPVALVSIGMSLKGGVAPGRLPLVATLSAFKLLLLPATVLAAATLYGLPRETAAALVLTSSVPSGVNAWLIANRFGTGQLLAASVIFATTLSGVATVTLWAYLLGA